MYNSILFMFTHVCNLNQELRFQGEKAGCKLGEIIKSVWESWEEKHII